MQYNLIVLSYHQFVDEPSDYRFSRTYDQFRHDIDKKIYDWITIDDGRADMIRACEMMRERNIRAKLFISTSLVGQPHYCTWDELRRLSKFHDIENHSHLHEWHNKQTEGEQRSSIKSAQEIIELQIGSTPRYFVPPYNAFNPTTENILRELGLVIVKDRETILNTSK